MYHQCSRIESSVIGIRTRIGIGTTIVSSYLMGIDYYETIEEIRHDKEHGLPSVGIGDRCYIRNCIVIKTAGSVMMCGSMADRTLKIPTIHCIP